VANRFSLDCPIDGTSLAVNRPPDAVRVGGQEVGTHIHVEFNVVLTCNNGHQWQLVADIIVKRVA